MVQFIGSVEASATDLADPRLPKDSGERSKHTLYIYVSIDLLFSHNI